MQPIKMAFCVAFVASGLANAGVILTFDLTNFGNIGMDQNYGDRVSAVSDAAGSYGTFGSGFTPNVVTSYGGTSLGNLTRWTTDYGDLVNVLENELDGDDRLTVTFTADPGYLVQLYSFSLGGWPNTDYTVPNVFVKDGNGTNIFSQASVPVQGATGTPRHTDLSFAPLVGSTIQIYIDLTGMGGNSDNIGIDNIAFAQVAGSSPVPEPGTLVMLIGGLGAAVALRRRRA